MIRLRAAPIALAAAALALPLAGCSVSFGGDDQADAEDVQKFVREGYERKTGLKLPELRCDDVKAEVGAPVRCSGRNERDVRVTIGGDVREVKDSRLRYRWEVTRALAPGRLFADSAQRLLADRVTWKVASVTCPDEVDVREGMRFSCDVAAASEKRWTLGLKLTDGDGAYEITALRPARAGGGEA